MFTFSHFKIYHSQFPLWTCAINEKAEHGPFNATVYDARPQGGNKEGKKALLHLRFVYLLTFCRRLHEFCRFVLIHIQFIAFKVCFKKMS